MRIAIGCDDTGLALKEPLVAALEADGHDVLDLGTFSTDPVDYPDYARAVGQAVLRGFVDASLLLCASGIGGVIAANKLRGIRAAMCHDVHSARRSREEVDANVLCLAGVGLEPKTAIEIAQAFIGTQFQAGDPQSRQVAKIGQLEAGLLGADKAPLQPTEEKAGRSKSIPPRPTPAKPAAPPRETPVEAPPPAPVPGI
jgi:ribose 5-phosphate isomerase B